MQSSHFHRATVKRCFLNNKYPPGKLPLDVLDRVLSKHTKPTDPRVLIGPGIGEDAAVIDFGDIYLVAKTDPITFATDDIGQYAIHVNANDIATMGAIPRWFLVTILLPERHTDDDLLDEIFSSLQDAAEDIDIAICGGHTEITVGLDRPIVIGQMLGEVAKDRLVQSSNLTPGDCILLTKGLGIEATSILAREKADELAAANIPSKTITRAANYLIDPGISVLKEARIACDTAKIHAMHDPTEGGVATALREMALAANVGLSINEEALFTTTETQQLCQTFNLDSLGIISSGALLIGVSESDANTVCAAIQNADIRCDIIGRAEDPSFGLKLNNTNLPHFDRDEIGKVFE